MLYVLYCETSQEQNTLAFFRNLLLLFPGGRCPARFLQQALKAVRSTQMHIHYRESMLKNGRQNLGWNSWYALREIRSPCTQVKEVGHLWLFGPSNCSPVLQVVLSSLLGTPIRYCSGLLRTPLEEQSIPLKHGTPNNPSRRYPNAMPISAVSVSRVIAGQPTCACTGFESLLKVVMRKRRLNRTTSSNHLVCTSSTSHSSKRIRSSCASKEVTAPIPASTGGSSVGPPAMVTPNQRK